MGMNPSKWLVFACLLSAVLMAIWLVNRLNGMAIKSKENSIVYFRGALPFSKFPRGVIAPIVTAVIAALEDCIAVRVQRRGAVIHVEAIVPWVDARTQARRDELQAIAERMLRKSVTTRFSVAIVYR